MAVDANGSFAGMWPHGVTVSTLDSESSDRGSNPREAFQNDIIETVVPRGLEPRTLRLLAVRSNQLSYETIDFSKPL